MNSLTVMAVPAMTCRKRYYTILYNIHGHVTFYASRDFLCITWSTDRIHSRNEIN